MKNKNRQPETNKRRHSRAYSRTCTEQKEEELKSARGTSKEEEEKEEEEDEECGSVRGAWDEKECRNVRRRSALEKQNKIRSKPKPKVKVKPKPKKTKTKEKTINQARAHMHDTHTHTRASTRAVRYKNTYQHNR